MVQIGEGVAAFRVRVARSVRRRTVWNDGSRSNSIERGAQFGAQSHRSNRRDQSTYLFLQGPTSTFFSRVAARLEEAGAKVIRINLCVGDQIFWSHPGAYNFRGRPEMWASFVGRVMDVEAVTHLVMLNEQRLYHRIAASSAGARNIKVVVTELGYLRPDWIILDQNGLGPNSTFTKAPEEILELAQRSPAQDLEPVYQDKFWLMALQDMLYNIANSLLWFLFPHYQRNHLHHPIARYIGTGFRLLRGKLQASRTEKNIEKLVASGKPYFILPLQMEADFQIRAYSDYTGHGEVIRQVIGSFAKYGPNDADLIVKIHPLDDGLVNWRKITRQAAEDAGISGRVKFLDGGPLGKMLRHAAGLVTVNSTTGIAALQADCPVIVLGEAVFDIPGQTFQGPLDQFWRQNTPPDRVLRDGFIDAILNTLHVRGCYFNEPGLSVAVDAVAEKLTRDEIGIEARRELLAAE